MMNNDEMMVIEAGELQLNPDKIYPVKIENIEVRNGNFGVFYRVTFSTDFGTASCVINRTNKGQLSRLLYATGLDVNKLDPSEKIDLNKLIGKEIAAKLSYSSEGYLRVSAFYRPDEVDDLPQSTEDIDF
jgi:hypothetical protein